MNGYSGSAVWHFFFVDTTRFMSRTESQNHGFLFEQECLKLYYGLNDSDAACLPYNGQWDLPRDHPKNHDRLAVSIKSHHVGSAVYFGDARRMWSISEDFMLILVSYSQNGPRKEVVLMDKLFISTERMRLLKGNLPLQFVESYHQGLVSYKAGEHEEARRFAREQSRKAAREFHTYLLLNPKIDSKTQRRLQCSLPAKHVPLLYGSFPKQPLSLPSERRKRNV